MSKGILIAGLLAIVSIGAKGADEEGKFTFNMGGGITAPMNPTGRFAGTSGNFVAGAGYNVSRNSSIIGEFMWSGLPPNVFVLHPMDAPFGKVSLYTLTVNYRYGVDRIHDSRFGMYGIGGGGWYYRYATVDQNVVVPPNTVCQPIYTWWGYACDTGGFVASQTVAFRGSSAGGLNAGVGFTIGLGNSTTWKFYTESRYHYAFNSPIKTALIPVTFGIRLN